MAYIDYSCDIKIKSAESTLPRAPETVNEVADDSFEPDSTSGYTFQDGNITSDFFAYRKATHDSEDSPPRGSTSGYTFQDGNVSPESDAYEHTSHNGSRHAPRDVAPHAERENYFGLDGSEHASDESDDSPRQVKVGGYRHEHGNVPLKVRTYKRPPSERVRYNTAPADFRIIRLASCPGSTATVRAPEPLSTHDDMPEHYGSLPAMRHCSPGVGNLPAMHHVAPVKNDALPQVTFVVAPTPPDGIDTNVHEGDATPELENRRVCACTHQGVDLPPDFGACKHTPYSYSDDLAPPKTTDGDDTSADASDDAQPIDESNEIFFAQVELALLEFRAERRDRPYFLGYGHSPALPSRRPPGDAWSLPFTADELQAAFDEMDGLMREAQTDGMFDDLEKLLRDFQDGKITAAEGRGQSSRRPNTEPVEPLV